MKRIFNCIKLYMRKKKINKLKRQLVWLTYVDDTMQKTNATDNNNITKDVKKNVKTFTKKWVDIILTVSLVDVQLVFLLAFLGKEQIAENLGICIVTEVIAVFGGYLIKAFMESHSIGKHEEEMERIKRNYYVESNTETENINDEPVG